MKFFAVLSSVLAAAAAEAQLPIAAQYLAGAGLYNGAGYAGHVGYAAPYAAGYGAVDARFAYGAPITALNAGPLTAGPVAAAPAITATAPIVNAQYAAAYAAPIAAAPVAYAAAPIAAAPVAYAAAPIAPQTSSQFQAQDEAGNIAYGYQNINSAKQERGNTYGGVEGSYSYVDEAGVHTVNYVADDFGFRVLGDNLPVNTGIAPLPVVDTPEVVEAKAAFFAAYNAEASRTKRSAQFVGAGLPYAGAYAGAYPLGAYAAAPLAATYATAPIAAAPIAAATYAAAPIAAATYAAAPIAAATYAAAPAAPAREATLTTIKLNPGHAVFYRVD